MKTSFFSLLLPISFLFVKDIYANSPPNKQDNSSDFVQAKYVLNDAQNSPLYVMHASPDEPPRPNVTKPLPNNKPNTDRVSPEVNSLSVNFEAAKGTMKWPVNAGRLVQSFGKYTHPTEAKVTLENLGIDIAAKEGSNVQTVFRGTVCRIEKIAGSYTVIVNHGTYYTVYSYLSKVNVKLGDRVESNQALGIIGKNDEGKTMLHFEVCKLTGSNNIVNEDPLYWINNF